MGNDVWCRLPPEALAIIQTMPKALEEIFPYSAESISASWTRACKFLGIEDLHFHDLRHSSASEMINAGVDLYTVGAVLGHKDARSTKRYSHLATSRLAVALGTIGKKSPPPPKKKAA